MSSLPTIDPKQVALVVAHPGHELRIFHWFQKYRPTMYVLTDGSGRDGVSRLHATTRLVERVGARAGNVFGPHSDREIYQSVLVLNCDLFHRLADRLTEGLIEQKAQFVLGDAAEGEFMSHDIWREARLLAVRRAEQVLGWPIVQYEFAVDSHPLNCPESQNEQKVHLELDEKSFGDKIDSAYEYLEVRRFVDEMMDAFGREAFRTECLFPVCDESLLALNPEGKPKYELHGEKLVAEGVYPDVIRYQSHLKPLARSLHAAFAKAA